MGDQGFDQRLGLGVVAAGDDLDDVVGDPVQDCGRGRAGNAGERFGELIAAGEELRCLGAQFGQSAADEFGFEGAVLERGQVAVDGLLGFGELGCDGGQFSAGVAAGVAPCSANSPAARAAGSNPSRPAV
ncbi:hypothetical protein [Nocardia sp. NPDC046763]|uniref:hypothetical protein n=1 Tax=Nocardia sp. NPDC046763 TaxID=3155256 RepID=UPI0033EBE8F9